MVLCFNDATEYQRQLTLRQRTNAFALFLYELFISLRWSFNCKRPFRSICATFYVISHLGSSYGDPSKSRNTRVIDFKFQFFGNHLWRKVIVRRLVMGGLLKASTLIYDFHFPFVPTPFIIRLSQIFATSRALPSNTRLYLIMSQVSSASCLQMFAPPQI